MEFQQAATRLNSLRRELKEMSLADIDKLSDNIAKIRAELEEEKMIEAAKEEERKAVIAAALEQLKASGLSKEEIESVISGRSTGEAKPKQVRGPVAPKYKVIDNEGNEHTWTGRGKTPLIFQQIKESEGDLEAYLIK